MWQLPWRPLFDTEMGVQQELEKEVGPKHPLWGKDPKAIGCRVDCDDILVRLLDGAVALVHLAWHGKIDTFPDKYPRTVFYSSLAAFHSRMEQDAVDYGEGA